MALVFFLLASIGIGQLSAHPPGDQFASPDFAAAEDSLAKMALQIVEPFSDQQRLDNNRLFETFLSDVLGRKGAFAHPFDSLETVAIQTCHQESFRIFTWYVPLSGQQFRYFGIVQLPEKENANHPLIMLHDATSDIRWQDEQGLSHERWFGAWYYDMIHFVSEGEPWYLLLGWKGDNPQTRMRIIEPFNISRGEPRFGAPVFGEDHEGLWRIVFSYAALVSMSLLVEQEFYQTESGWHDMVVFDRLAPMHESMRGDPQYYVPEANIFDGLYFHQGKWVLVKDVDARLPERVE